MKIAELANQGKDTTAPKSPFDNHRRPSAERTRRSSIHYINESPVHRHSILHLHWLIWIFFVSSYFEFNVNEASSPLNRAAIKGDKVQLDCSTTANENGYWKYTKPFESYEWTIYNGAKIVNDMKTLFSVNDSVQGHFNLVFNASESTSGQYICQPHLRSAVQSAEVIVLETPPNCSMVEALGFVTATCSIDFDGNWAPEIQWYNTKGQLETNETSTIDNRRVTSLLVVPYNQSDTMEFDITCTPTFAQEKKPRETTAINVPILLRNCTLTIGSPTEDSSTQPITTTDAAIPPSATNYTVVIVVCVCVLIIVCAVPLLSMFLYKRKMCTKRLKNKDPAKVSSTYRESASMMHAVTTCKT